MERVLVTGGAGFIGSSLVEKLLAQKKKVTALDNFSAGIFEDIKDLQDDVNFELAKGDVLDTMLLEKLVGNSDTVFHLSANPEVRIGLSNTGIDFQQNITATHNLLVAMKQSPSCKKIIFTSSSTVYGSPASMPTDERYSPLSPISLYGASKLACEAMISGYCHMFDMRGIVIRLANIVGPRSRHGVIYDFVKKLESDPSVLTILGDGKQNKSYLYIDDCIGALLCLADTTSTFNVANVGSDDQLTVSELAKIIFSELRLNNVKITYSGGLDGAGWKGDVKDMLLDCNKAKSLGWKAKYTSSDAVTLSVRRMTNRGTDRIRH